MLSKRKKWIRLFLLVAIVPLVFLGTLNRAHATACAGAVVTSGSCDVTVAGVVDAGLLTMTTLPIGLVTGPLDGNGAGHIQLNGTPQTVNFKITTVLIDARGGTSGWKLQANSAGITIGSVTAAVQLNQLDNTSTCVSTCLPTLGSLTFTPLTLTTTATTFLSTGNPGSTVDTGNYSLFTDGSFVLPSDAAVGAYSGTITLTLSSTY